jgi:hypothetical protein
MDDFKITLRIDGRWERFELPRGEIEQARERGAGKPPGSELGSWIVNSEQGVPRRFSLKK